MRGKVGTVITLAALALSACKTEGFPDDDVDASVRYDARPKPDGSVLLHPDGGALVQAVGSATTLDIGCWNVENFPKAAGSVQALADLIAALDLDLVAVEEINDPAAFQAVIARLPGWKGVLGSGNAGGDLPQRIGYFWKESVVTLTESKALFTASSYEFPRPPFQATVTANGKSFTIIAVHLKAGVAAADQERRRLAHIALEGHLRNLSGGTLLCGDFNQEVYEETDAGTGTIYAPYLDDSARYRILTAPLDRAGAVTFLDYENMLDQMVSTSGLDPLVAGEAPLIPPLHDEYAPYENVLSDHLPIVIRLHP
jgi:hypothetical protein